MSGKGSLINQHRVCTFLLKQSFSSFKSPIVHTRVLKAYIDLGMFPQFTNIALPSPPLGTEQTSQSREDGQGSPPPPTIFVTLRPGDNANEWIAEPVGSSSPQSQTLDVGEGCSSGSNTTKRQKTNKVRSYICKTCGKAFYQRSHLIVHSRQHTGERPYVCSHCGKAFSHKSHLTVHERGHSSEKFFQCSVCNKAFYRKDDLTRHQRTHSKEKPYICSHCNKAFAQKVYLARHQRMHAGESFACNQCSKAFTRKYNLTRHQKTHSR